MNLDGSLIKLALRLALLLTAMSVGAAEAEQTARAALKPALAAAQKWRPDAALTGVSALQATPEGKAKTWSYMFYSGKSGLAYSVTSSGGKVVDAMEVRPHVKDPVVAEFVDSDLAAGVGKANGANAKVMSLLVMGQATKVPASVWTVSAGFQPGALSVMVDASSGKMLFKQEVPR